MYKTLLSLCTPCEVRNHYDLDEDHGLQTLPADLGNVKQIIQMCIRDRVNTKCNLPAQIDIEATEGMEYEFLCVTKGGRCV